MIQGLIIGLIILGSALMLFNIIGFISYARFVKGRDNWSKGSGVLYIPIVFLCLFLVGYLVVGIFGKPDLVMAGILFGGSIFVFIMWILLNRITKKIIESERIEAELKSAEESNRAKNAFLASISHEMRTPMNVILGLDELALKRTDLPGDTRMQLVKIGRSGRHLLALINNTLDMQNIESGKRKLKNEPFSLREVIDQIEAMVRTMCEEKGLRFYVVQGPVSRDGLIGDDMLLKQVLMNVLDNAIKYTTAPGDVTLMMEQVSEDHESAVLRFVVKDTGIGISPEFLPKIFDLFTQEDATFTNRYGGSGMGLAVAKQEVELLKGNISAESEPGKGSAFTITVRFLFSGETAAKAKQGLTEQEVNRELEEKAEAAMDGSRDGVLQEPENTNGKTSGKIPEISLAGCRILIVEDVDENAEIVKDLLELEGAFSEHAENGLIALSMIEHSSPGYYDAILMDLRMPVMDGINAAKSIRELEREDAKSIPIIALTANAFDVDIKNTEGAGMNAHLVKPIDSDLLYATLRKWIFVNRKGRVGGEEGTNDL